MAEPIINDEQIEAYSRDGAVLVKGLFRDFIDQIRQGIEYNMREPGPFASENLKADEQGRFFDDYCNWTRIPQFQEAIYNSPAADVAAALMRSSTVQMFHDHVLVKEPGTSKPTPWHQDSPYYFVNGEQTLSFWSPMDTVKESSLRCVAGSHKWAKAVLPIRWMSEENFYPDPELYMPVPDPDQDPNKYNILEWPMEPGDAVAFNFKTLHGSRGNLTSSRRRAFSLRLLGDDARYITRPGRTSPPFPGHGMADGQRLREDWFPVIKSA